MKLISLNAWGGKLYQPLINFIKEHLQNTDIFCFQEIFKTTSKIKDSSGFRLNLYSEIEKILKGYKGYFSSSLENYIAGSFQPNFIDFNLSWGLAIFIKKNIEVISQGNFFVFGNKGSFDPKNLNSLPRNVQYMSFLTKNKKFILCNIHGIWVKGTKNDTPSRIEQSEKIKKFLKKYNEEKILCGDFNLNLNTQSLQILEEDLINLIKKNNIPTTRNKYFPEKDKYADYTLVSPELNVLDFQVPNIEVSDHLPMLLEFE